MLKCPECGRTGGPFRLKHQIQVDGQVLRSWLCPCGDCFQAGAGAEKAPGAQPPYTGFTLDWNGNTHTVGLKRVGKNETAWEVGPWTIVVTGPPDGPGTRIITLMGDREEPLGEWRLQPGWGPSEIGRRLKVWPLPPELVPDFLAKVLVRVLS